MSSKRVARKSRQLATSGVALGVALGLAALVPCSQIANLQPRLVAVVTGPVVPAATLSAVAGSTTEADVSWSNATPTSVGRNGVDSTGHGAWSTSMDGRGILPAEQTARKIRFSALVPGATYTYTMTRSGSADLTVTFQQPALAVATVTAVAVSSTQTDVKWSNVTPTSVGRNGVDSTGYPAWDTTVGGRGISASELSAKSLRFSSLVPGSTYTYTVTRSGGANLTVTFKQPAATTTPPTTTPPTTTPPTTTPPVTPPAPVAVVTAVAVSPTQADVKWSNVTATVVGRDGVDSTGHGAWDTSMDGRGILAGEASAKTIRFSALVPGATYTYTVARSGGANLTVTFKQPAATTTPPTTTPPTTTPPTTTPPVTPPPAGAGQRNLRFGYFKWNNVQQAIDFGNSVGVPVDVWHVSVLSGDTTLEAFTNFGGANWLKANPNRLMVTNWNWLTNFPGKWDNPTTDTEARNFARKIQSLGVASQTVVRPGYEMNANWMPWGNQFGDNQQGEGFKRLWRRIIPIMKAEAPGLRFDWSVQPGDAGQINDPARFYPGDDVVDFVTMDQYDWWLSGTPEQRFNGFINGPTRGLPWLRDFANAHGKKWGIDETGLVSSSNGTQGGGDNPYFITSLYNWAEANGAYWIMYENTDDDIDTYLESNPNGFNAFKSWFQTHRTLIP